MGKPEQQAVASPEAPSQPASQEAPVDDRSEDEKKLDENTFNPSSFSI